MALACWAEPPKSHWEVPPESWVRHVGQCCGSHDLSGFDDTRQYPGDRHTCRNSRRLDYRFGYWGATIFYTVGKFIRSGAANDERRKRMKEDLKAKLASHTLSLPQKDDDAQFKAVIDVLKTAEVQKKISKEYGIQILALLQKGQLTPAQVLDGLKAML